MKDPYSLQLSSGAETHQAGTRWWISVRLPWFRALPFWSVESLTITASGRAMREADLTFTIDGRALGLAAVRELGRYWEIGEPLKIGVRGAVPAPGAEIDAELTLRMPEGAGADGQWPRRVVRETISFARSPHLSWPIGVCTFSFAGELRRGRSLQSCFDRVGAIGGFAGVDILGPQAVAGYPAPSGEALQRVAGMVRGAGLTPLVYGAYIDPGRLPVPDSEPALLGAVESAMDSAAATGCAYVRINVPPRGALLEAIADIAAARDVCVLTELHATTTADAGTQDLLELLRRIDSDHLAFVLDLSCVMRALPRGFVDGILRDAIPDEAVRMIVEGWTADEPEEQTRRQLDRLGSSVAEAAFPLLARTRRLFRHSHPSWLSEVLPWTRMIHGKFFDVRDGEDQALAHADIFDELRRADFQGTILSEYEGHLWSEEPDTFEQLSLHRDMIATVAHD